MIDSAFSMHTILIRYNDKFESAPAEYKNSNTVLLWVLPIFGLVGIGFWISLIIEVADESISKKVLKLGTAKKATFITSNSGVIVNDVPYFSIKYQYVDEHGNTRLKKTQSKYTYDEQAFFQQLSEFDIKEYHGHVAINQKIDIAELTKVENAGISYQEPSKYPAMEIDLSFVTDRFAEISEAIKNTKSALVKKVSVTDIYSNGDEKSITVRILFEHLERTLTHEEVQEVVDKIIDELKKKGINLKN